MGSINKIWPGFDIESGVVEMEEFKRVMVQVAQDQGLYDGEPEEVEQATVFFTDDNLNNIFDQIVDHESKQP